METERKAEGKQDAIDDHIHQRPGVVHGRIVNLKDEGGGFIDITIRCRPIIETRYKPRRDDYAGSDHAAYVRDLREYGQMLRKNKAEYMARTSLRLGDIELHQPPTQEP